MERSATATLPASIEKDAKMLIGADWVDASGGGRFDVENPATEECVATVPAGEADDIDRAVKAARESFEAGVWRRNTAVQRERIMWRMSDLLWAQREELARIETIDCGMPNGVALRAIERAIDGFRYYAGMCTKISGRTVDISGQRAEFHAYSQVEPVGVAGLIVPWNSPLSAALNKVAPALASGCSAVLKPAEQTPLTALRLGQIALDAGLPPGVLNVVTGFGVHAGAALANHHDVDKVSFTGSTTVGKELIRASAGNLKRLSLELGGKSPVFVFPDADMRKAIPRAAAAIFANAGQVCYAGSRLFVHEECYDEVLDGIAKIAATTQLGDGFAETTQMGPLISARQADRVMSYIDTARQSGVELLAGGARPDGPGHFVQPTVFSHVSPDTPLVSEEIFGPVLAAMPFSDPYHAAALANDTRYGLGAGIFTQNLSVAHKLASRIKTGNVWVNFYGGSDKALPFGGYKESGWGREGGPEGIDAFLEHKAVYMRL